MSPRRTYLDYNASAPLRRGARVAMNAAMGLMGNASSVHAEGRAARGVIEHARDLLAVLLGASVTEVVFTSGATEANAWVLGAPWDAIFAAGIEHESILAGRQRAEGHLAAPQLIDLPVDAQGIVTAATLRAQLQTYFEARQQSQSGQSGQQAGQTRQARQARQATQASQAARAPRILVCLQMANNETGIIQPVAQAATIAHEFGALLHTDAVQAVGRVPVSFSDLGADFMSVSGHKIGGPKGIGALLIRDGIDLPRLISGGGQERQWRAGTENVAAIAGFGSAADAVAREIATMPRLAALRHELEQGVLRAAPAAQIVGRDVARLANTSCFALPGQAAETLVIKLDLEGLAVSAGSACSSGKVGASHVLEAMGLREDVTRCAIRVSMGWGTSQDDIDAFLSAWQRITSGARATNYAVA